MINNNRRLDGKNAIITGCNRGIGKKIAELFANNGANIYACARTKSEEFEQWADTLAKDNNVFVKTIYFDCGSEDSIKDGLRTIVSEKKDIDILVNNAGIAASGTLRMTSVKKLKEVFDVNFFSAIQIMQLVSGVMIRQKKGAIINIASAGGIEAQPGYLAYGSSKAALIWATRSVSKELGQFGIRVNAVAPGQTKTDMGGAYKTEEELQSVIRRTGLKRMGKPEEIANAVLFLASDESSFITGEIMQVDGGRV